jgi:hypothetical protein
LKKLKGRLIRKIANVISCAILYCDGKGYFKISNVYRFPLSTHFFLDITKNMGFSFSYHVILKREGLTIMDTILDYDIFRKDVPIYRAYTLKETRIIGELDNVAGLKGILKQMYEETGKT